MSRNTSPASRRANREPGRPATVLVVDDDDDARASVRGTLEAEKFRVLEASGGADGITLFAREYSECVIVDAGMPEVDGFATCERIRALPRGDETTIIFLTGRSNLDTFERALRAGADDFVTKPVLPDELLVRVEAARKLRWIRAMRPGVHELLKRQHDGLLRLQLEKERLMAFVVHDLKNPVNALDLHAQLVLREPALPERVRDSASQIRAEAQQLNRMIMNLLDVSKAGEGKLTAAPSRLDLPAVVAEVVAELDVLARAHDVTIRASLNVEEMNADRDLLRRILANLIENAVRHAPSGSEVTVTAVPAPSGTELRVADRGPGVPAELRERIFDAFVQADSDAELHAAGSRGLGLTFCKLAARAHGGRISVEDAAPGAVFCVTLPGAP